MLKIEGEAWGFDVKNEGEAWGFDAKNWGWSLRL